MNLKLIIFSLLVMISIAATNTNQSLKVDVPAAVLDAMNARYPDAENVKWETEDDDEYEAEFKMDKAEMSATFEEDGTWVETETKMKKSDLPNVVKEAIALEFEEYKIESVEKLETPDYPVAYEVSLENEEEGAELEVVLSPEGEILTQKIKGEDEELEGGSPDDY